MRKLLHAKKVWNYGFGMEVETASHGNPRIVTNRNDEAYNVYDSRGGLIKTVRKGEFCEVYKEKRIDRVYAYLVHIDSLMTTVIWRNKTTMLKGLPEIIGRRYRVEKAKWIETLKVMKEMHLQINGLASWGSVYPGISATLLSEQNVLDRDGFVVNINKMHKAFPLITMDGDLSRVDSVRRRVLNADWNRRTERGEIIPVADTSIAGVDRWFSEKGWTKEGVLAEVIEVPDDPAAARILEELRQSAGKDIDDIEVARLRELRSHLYDDNGNMKPGASKEWKRYHQEAEARRTEINAVDAVNDLVNIQIAGKQNAEANLNDDVYEKNRVQEMHDYLYDANGCVKHKSKGSGGGPVSAGISGNCEGNGGNIMTGTEAIDHYCDAVNALQNVYSQKFQKQIREVLNNPEFTLTAVRVHKKTDVGNVTFMNDGGNDPSGC